MSDDEMSDSEMWRLHKERGQQKRAANREASMRLLQEAAIHFEVRNDGAHLIVMGRFDFWPGTGLWLQRGTRMKKRGVHALIARIEQEKRDGRAVPDPNPTRLTTTMPYMILNQTKEITNEHDTCGKESIDDEQGTHRDPRGSRDTTD